MTRSQRDEFIGHMRNGMRRGAAAEAMGLSRMAVMCFIADDDEFRAAVEDAEGQATEHVEEALYQAAVSGNVTAAKIWLERRVPAPSTDLTLPGPTGDDMDSVLRGLSTE